MLWRWPEWDKAHVFINVFQIQTRVSVLDKSVQVDEPVNGGLGLPETAPTVPASCSGSEQMVPASPPFWLDAGVDIGVSILPESGV